MMKEKVNMIETEVVDVKVTASYGAGEATQINNDAEPIKNIKHREMSH